MFNDIEELKNFLIEQAEKFNIDINSTEKVMSTQTPWGIDEQLETQSGDTAILYYLDRSTPDGVEIKAARFDMREVEPRGITRDEWIELGGLQKNE